METVAVLPVVWPDGRESAIPFFVEQVRDYGQQTVNLPAGTAVAGRRVIVVTETGPMWRLIGYVLGVWR